MELDSGLISGISIFYAYAIIVRLVKGFRNPIFLGIIVINALAFTVCAISAIGRQGQLQTGTAICLFIGFSSFVYLVSVVRDWDENKSAISKDMQGVDCESSKGKNALIAGFVNALSVIGLFTHN